MRVALAHIILMQCILLASCATLGTLAFAEASFSDVEAATQEIAYQVKEKAGNDPKAKEETKEASDEAPDEAPDDETSDEETSDEETSDEEPATEEPATEEPAEEQRPASGEKESDEKSKEDTDSEDTAGEEKESDSQPKNDESKKNDPEEAPAEEEAAVESDREVEVDPPEEEKKSPQKSTKPPTKDPKAALVEKWIIGATAQLLEKQSELLFNARIDSGAKSCSLHIEKMEIEDEAEKMVDNIGKVIRFQVKNGEEKTHWLASKIAGYVIIKTSNNTDSKERRYKVPLTFRWKHMEKEVLVTLNDRGHMEYPLLLGRNFLRGDFLVDVELNSDD